MLKQQLRLCLLAAVFSFGLLQGADQPVQTQSQTAKNNEKYDILRRDQIDTTDVFAIPFDDSEVEDEEEINRDEKKDVFPLPHSK